MIAIFIKFIHIFSSMYRFLNNEISDPRTQDYFMIGNPFVPGIFIFLYVYFVFYLGPKFMEKRSPFKLYRILQIYNLFQVIICSYTFYKALVLAWLFEYSFTCQPVDYSYSPQAVKITHIVWLYFITKIIDLLDTIFFVLRKKNNQVSFLHMYHHIGMVVGSWCAVKYMPGGHVTFLGVINSFVHIIMYTYYLMSSMQIKIGSWKKYITQLQLFQFLLITIHYSQLLWVEDCGFPLWPAAVMVPQNLFMMILFSDFYYKAYIKKKPASEVKTKKSEINGISMEITNGKPKGQ